MFNSKDLVQKFVAGSVMVLVVNVNDEGEAIDHEKFVVIPLLVFKSDPDCSCKQSFRYCNIPALVKCLGQADAWISAQLS